MPRFTDPKQRQVIVLACDVDLPAETQPRIFARTLTLGQQRELIQHLAAMKSSTDDPAALFDSALDAAMVCLVGWENMNWPDTGQPIEFCRQNVEQVLTLEELTEVFEYVSAVSKPSKGDEKKSE